MEHVFFLISLPRRDRREHSRTKFINVISSCVLVLVVLCSSDVRMIGSLSFNSIMEFEKKNRTDFGSGPVK